MTITTKARYFWPLVMILFVTDCTTKDLVVDRLDHAGTSEPIFHSFARLTLVHNPGTAFGFDLRPYIGAWSRPLLILAMVSLLAVLFRIYWITAPRARLAAIALGLACGGAIGNIVDRMRFPDGVVDFIDVGVGSHRFWTFNVADAGILIGALLLALVLFRDDGRTIPSRPTV